MALEPHRARGECEDKDGSHGCGMGGAAEVRPAACARRYGASLRASSKCCPGLGGGTLPLEGEGELEVRVGQVGREAHGLAQAGDGALDVALAEAPLARGPPRRWRPAGRP